ncbi:MAG TPA: hypothetical protein VEV44_07315 [Pseudoneobacillus sp.]|nr:hypothetical protein [Pseudoneobacillus sp.]
MDLYHSWIYIHILNTKWFIWTIVIAIFVLNFIGPILIWLVMNSKGIPFLRKKEANEKK